MKDRRSLIVFWRLLERPTGTNMQATPTDRALRHARAAWDSTGTLPKLIVGLIALKIISSCLMARPLNSDYNVHKRDANSHWGYIAQRADDVVQEVRCSTVA